MAAIQKSNIFCNFSISSDTLLYRTVKKTPSACGGDELTKISTAGHTGIYACGDERLLLSMKQEKECLVN